MTEQDLTGIIWGQLGVRKHLVGRRAVGRIVSRAVQEFPLPTAANAQDFPGPEHVAAEATVSLAARLNDGERYGVVGFLAILVLSAIIGEVIRRLVDWWLASSSNRVAMATLRGTPCGTASRGP